VVVEDYYDFDLLDLETVFTSFKSFTEFSFNDGEYCFNVVSLMISLIIEHESDPISIIPEDSFPFSVSDGNVG